MPHRPIIFCTAFALIAITSLMLYTNFPEFTEEERADFKLPSNLEHAKRLGRVLLKYKDAHYYTVLLSIAITYIMLQAVAIPGSIFLTVLLGYLYPFPVALFAVCACSAFGAQLCYFLALYIGRDYIIAKAPEQIRKWQNEVTSFDSLLYCIIFLRITPVLPNWFINIASPVFDVPIYPFFFGTFIGVAPPSAFYIQAGAMLQKLTSVNAAWSWTAVLCVATSALISLIPVVCRHCKRRSDEKTKVS